MDIRSERWDARHLITLTGRFDAHETPRFREHLADLLVQGGGPAVEIDLSAVHFIDSSALAELLRTDRAATDAGATLVLLNPSDPVRVIFELTALDQAFSIRYAPTVPDTPGSAG
jgi:anti-sigma B factor antagonist